MIHHMLKFGILNIVKRKNIDFSLSSQSKVEKLQQHMNANNYMNALAKTLMESVNKFASETRVENIKKTCHGDLDH